MEDKNKWGNTKFLRTLRYWLQPLDTLAVVLVPLVLGAVYRLPAETRRELAFEHADPSLVTAFAGTFVHLGPEHLLANVVTYVAAVSVALLFATMNGTRHRFYAAFGLFLVAFPVVLSYLNLAFVGPVVGIGFSGIVMAFVGYLPMAVAEYFEEHFEIGPRGDLAPLLFIGSLALIGVLSLRSIATDHPRATLATVGVTLLAALSALVYGRAVSHQTDRICRKIRSGLAFPGYVEMATVGIVLVGVVQFVAFPSNPTAGQRTLNIYTHLLGYALGFIIVYTAVETADRRQSLVSSLPSLPRINPRIRHRLYPPYRR